ncbi:MAG: hypothetical protein Q9165_005166 [Trypethelium subeluteriae]
MAAEDGLCLGVLFGLLNSHRLKSEVGDVEPSKGENDEAYESPSLCHPTVPEVLALYESLRKQRTTINILGALDNRSLYHSANPSTVAERNDWLEGLNWERPDDEHETSTNLNQQKQGSSKSSSWRWGDMRYQTDLLRWDTYAEAVREFRRLFEKSL